jgi:hypothetical protein
MVFYTTSASDLMILPSIIFILYIYIFMRIGHRSLIKLPVTMWWLKLGIAEWHLRHR